MSTTALDYITRIHATQFYRPGGGDPLLAVVISGRATGRRAVVLVVSSDYKVFLEQRLYRFWELDAIPVKIRSDPSIRAEIVVVGPGCEKSLVLRPRKAD